MLFALYIGSVSVQADSSNWYYHAQVPFQQGQFKLVDLKVKLMEMSALRKWDILDQDYQSFSMQLKGCKAQLVFNQSDVLIKLNQKNGDDWDSKCSSNWTGNLKKDIKIAINLSALKQQAYELDKQQTAQTK